MRHITIRGTLNEYDVEDRFYVIDEQGIKQYVFIVLEEVCENDVIVTKKYTLVTAITDVIENICAYDEQAIKMLEMQSELAAKHVIDEARKAQTLTGEHYYG